MAEEVSLFEKAGKITAGVLEKAAALAKPGGGLLEYAEKVEGLIRAEGALPAFPVNIGINSVAAHYTPPKGEEAVFGENDVVKIDLGAQAKGCCGDAAKTIDFSGESGKLVEASEAALEAAIACVRAGAKTSGIGAAVEKEIRQRGFKPIENLTGHSLREYTLHAGVVVPNIETRSSQALKEGDILAIEPFASTGRGRVSEGTQVEIFSFVGRAQARQKQARELQEFVEKEFNTLPFAERWLYKKFSSRLFVQSALKELTHAGALIPHPILSDAPGSLVSQAEHTVLVEKGGCRVLTRA